ncbi:hypothetical protein FOXB_04605 [Fusarium oxysporum f. sp. conglutinans Fo5176]|uniref:Uncharacterized protein n=1 Tax=Fusarium oxysporum (strain Fo5176) TaxID=660025 RepID=F9FDX7_FUSOF|nr:hypothetical protein FOXB_04605 [Fusarium oxysporum f. sp. conglutinans Fo5176]
MPAEGFAIWAVIASTVGVINTVIGWIQTVRKFKKKLDDVEETLREIELGYAGSESSLEGWKAMWEIDDREKLQVVRKTAPKVLRKLDVIKDYMATVKERSKEAFEHKHQMPISPAQSRAQLSLAWKKMFFELGYESRITSKGFYDSCREAKEKFESNHIELEMDIFRQVLDPNKQVNPTMTLELRYSIIFPLQTRIQEFSVKGPLSFERDPPWTSASFHGACLEALSSSGSQFFRVQSGGEEEWFGSTVPPACKQMFPQGRVSQGEKLNTMLYHLHTPIASQPANKFYLPERIRFAFKVAECGFFLCGTSWLVDLRSRNIRSIRDIDHNRHFLLKTEASRYGFEDAQYQRFAEHRFAIGVLLVEIGTGKSVERFSPSSEGAGYTFSLCQAGTTAVSNVGMDKVLSDLSEVMGVPYAESVKACLRHRARRQTSPAEPREAYREMLEEYYFNVYQPVA